MLRTCEPYQTIFQNGTLSHPVSSLVVRSHFSMVYTDGILTSFLVFFFFCDSPGALPQAHCTISRFLCQGFDYFSQFNKRVSLDLTYPFPANTEIFSALPK